MSVARIKRYVFVMAILFAIPHAVFAYGQGYYQGYYQSYYQPYYQSSYGGTTNDVVISRSSKNTAGTHLGISMDTVFISKSIGYTFFVAPEGTCVYTKTTDGGVTWAASTTVDTQTDCIRISVWYDQWTPGDTTGTTIHISTIDSGSSDMWYNTLNTSGDTLGTIVNATGANQGGSLVAGANWNTITKSTSGVLYMGLSDNSDSYVIKCSTTCSSAGNWTEAGTNPMDADIDPSILLPLGNTAILLINHDISADTLRSKFYSATSSSWSASWVTIASSVNDNTTYQAGISAMINASTRDIYLAYIDDSSTLGSDDDINTAVFASSTLSWTSKTAVETNGGNGGITGVALGIDGNTNYVWVAYSTMVDSTNSGTWSDIFWRRSSDGMTTWGNKEGPANNLTASSTVYGVGLTPYSTSRMYLTWFSPAPGTGAYYGYTVSGLTAFSTRLTLSGTVKFLKNLVITGSVSKGSGSFEIDHPLDPKNKLLYHSFVESPDAKNIYDGVAELDENGVATIQLPAYFEALNKNFRYQYQPIGKAMPNLYIKQEVKNNQFVIAGGVAGGKVSWQITGTRHDAYIIANPIKVEVEKGPKELVNKGECLYEPLCQ